MSRHRSEQNAARFSALGGTSLPQMGHLFGTTALSPPRSGAPARGGRLGEEWQERTFDLGALDRSLEDRVNVAVRVDEERPRVARYVERVARPTLVVQEHGVVDPQSPRGGDHLVARPRLRRYPEELEALALVR